MATRVILDTNVMIGFLIGKRLSKLKYTLSSASFSLIYTNQLIEEIKQVTSCPKFKKYFSRKDVSELIELISIIGEQFHIQNIPNLCRDPKDIFLLELSDLGKADYLVSGDKDLLDLREYKLDTNCFSC